MENMVNTNQDNPVNELKKKILITGGTGYLGSHFINKFYSKYDFIILKRSFSDISKLKIEDNSAIYYDLDKIVLKNIFEENKIDLVFHCATNYGRSDQSELNILDCNLTLPVSLLQLSTKYKIKSFINTDTILDKGVSHYALSKNHFNEWFKIFSNKITFINARLEHFYGPNDDKTKFISKILNLLLTNVEQIDLTKGDQIRYFLHIDDVIDAFDLIISKIDNIGKGYHNIDLGASEGISIKEVTLLLKELTINTTTFLNFGAIEYRPNEVMNPNLNLKFILELGWESKIKLEQGLKDIIEFENKSL
jgi:nucleoside-diphosphate-sugar epimerase